MDFNAYLKGKAEECNLYLNRYFNGLKNDHSTVYEAMRYSIEAGGKRLRMIMLTEACRLFADDYTDSMPFGCAMEMIHAYSLIHDDLPAMDNGTQRRGKPCNHLVYGEDMAILAGDGLLSCAFEIMTEHAIANKENSYAYMRAIYEISHGAGISGMLLGQSIDVQTEDKPKDITLLEEIHRRKTAAMFTGAVKAGAIIGGGSEKDIKAMGGYGDHFGLAFQITDDILDETGDMAKLGKDTGLDRKNEKATYSSLLGVEKARATAKAHMDAAKDLVRPIDRHGFFTNLCNYVLDRDR